VTALSLDLRLLSGPSGALFGGSTDWVAGVYVLDQRVDLVRQYTFLPPKTSPARFETRRVAAYGELTHAFTPRTRMTLGLRAERHSASYRNSDALRFRSTWIAWSAAVWCWSTM
jgi:iron complex outermembrane recepter protein